MKKYRGKKGRLPVIPPYAREELEERWRKAGIENDYIFSVVMQDPEIFLQLMQRILPELHLTRVRRHEQQRTQYGAWGARYVRYDVYSEIDGVHFVVEMQMKNLPSLRRRMRYYQSMIDIQNLKPREDYQELPDSFVIMICPFDMFGQGRHLYRFRNMDIYDRNLELGDGADKIFLNAKGTVDDIGQGLKNFLELVSGKAPADAYCEQVAESVYEAKNSVEVKRMFMNVNLKEMETRYYDRKEARAEGLAEGRAEGRAEALAEVAQGMFIEGLAVEQIARVLKTDEQSVREMVRDVN